MPQPSQKKIKTSAVNKSPAIGRRLGLLVVEEVDPTNSLRFIVRCDCGRSCTVWRSNFAGGRVRTCGDSHCKNLLRANAKNASKLAKKSKALSQLKSVERKEDADVLSKTDLPRNESNVFSCDGREEADTTTNKTDLIDETLGSSLVGKTFGRLTVLGVASGDARKLIVSCSCGAGPLPAWRSRFSEHAKLSCGCVKRERGEKPKTERVRGTVGLLGSSEKWLDPKAVAYARMARFITFETHDQDIQADFPGWAYMHIMRGRKATPKQLYVDYLRERLGRRIDGVDGGRAKMFATNSEPLETLPANSPEPGDKGLWELVTGQDRMILKLVFQWGFSQEEVADVMGVTGSYISQRILSSTKRLRKTIDGESSGERAGGPISRQKQRTGSL